MLYRMSNVIFVDKSKFNISHLDGWYIMWHKRNKVLNQKNCEFDI